MDRNQIIKIVVLIVGILALVYVVNLYLTSKNTDQVEDFDGGDGVSPSEPLGGNTIYRELEGDEQNNNAEPKDSFPKDQLSPSDLLPSSGDSKWSQSVPSSGKLGDQNFLTAGYHVGVNTVGQSLRNANRQLRSEPNNPQVNVSPWQQSTISPDANRKPLEIGAQSN